MIPETMLEYLTLQNVMYNNFPASWENLNSKANQGWYSDSSTFEVDLTKVKQRLTELEREIMKPYVIDKTS